MQVGVLGSGEVGRTLAAGFAARGDEVVLGTRTPDRRELVRWAKSVGGSVTLGSFADAARSGKLVVLAVHGDSALSVLEAVGPSAFEGKVVLDVTNPLQFSGGVATLFVGTSDSLGEQVQRALPGAKVVKAFNTVGNGQMVHPKVKGHPRLELLIAGNDAGAKRTVTEIAKSFGWSGTLDAGSIDAARGLEALVPLWLRLGTPLHTYRHVWVVARD